MVHMVASLVEPPSGTCASFDHTGLGEVDRVDLPRAGQGVADIYLSARIQQNCFKVVTSVIREGFALGVAFVHLPVSTGTGWVRPTPAHSPVRMSIQCLLFPTIGSYINVFGMYL